MAENLTYRVEPDGFYGELVRPTEDKYPGKALICFSGSDGGIGLARMLAGVFAGAGADGPGSGLCDGGGAAQGIPAGPH